MTVIICPKLSLLIFYYLLKSIVTFGSNIRLTIHQIFSLFFEQKQDQKSRIFANINDWNIAEMPRVPLVQINCHRPTHPVHNKLFKLHLMMEDFQNNAKLILIDSEMTMFKELQNKCVSRFKLRMWIQGCRSPQTNSPLCLSEALK